jgi:hypothetical protein
MLHTDPVRPGRPSPVESIPAAAFAAAVHSAGSAAAIGSAAAVHRSQLAQCWAAPEICPLKTAWTRCRGLQGIQAAQSELLSVNGISSRCFGW